jgi:hypothetical protein
MEVGTLISNSDFFSNCYAVNGVYTFFLYDERFCLITEIWSISFHRVAFTARSPGFWP